MIKPCWRCGHAAERRVVVDYTRRDGDLVAQVRCTNPTCRVAVLRPLDDGEEEAQFASVTACWNMRTQYGTWIAMAERQPATNGYYIVRGAIYGSEKQQVWPCYWSAYTRTWNTSVTHDRPTEWMPLPDAVNEDAEAPQARMDV